jgi:hypothetical protein
MCFILFPQQITTLSLNSINRVYVITALCIFRATGNSFLNMSDINMKIQRTEAAGFASSAESPEMKPVEHREAANQSPFLFCSIIPRGTFRMRAKTSLCTFI